MENVADIIIRISGKQGNIPLSPEVYDIREIKDVIDNFENLLFPNQKKDRPLVSYSLEEGSVKHVFRTSLQAVVGFTAILAQIQSSNNIDFLESKSAVAVEAIQKTSVQKNYTFEISSSLQKDLKLEISPKTKFEKSESIWAEAEFYFYGTLTNAGGKSAVNIHLDTKEFGSITIDTPKEYLKKLENNLLYRRFGVRALGKQNSKTGEIDTSSLKLIDLTDFEPKFDEEYLKAKIKKARSKWTGVDKNKWLHDLRGGYDA